MNSSLVQHEMKDMELDGQRCTVDSTEQRPIDMIIVSVESSCLGFPLGHLCFATQLHGLYVQKL